MSDYTPTTEQVREGYAKADAETVNGLNARDWFDIAVAKEQAIDGYLTRIAELESGERGAKADAWDEGVNVGYSAPFPEDIPNPYRERGDDRA